MNSALRSDIYSWGMGALAFTFSIKSFDTFFFFNGEPLWSVSVKQRRTIMESLFQADIYKSIAFDKKVAFSNTRC